MNLEEVKNIITDWHDMAREASTTRVKSMAFNKYLGEVLSFLDGSSKDKYSCEPDFNDDTPKPVLIIDGLVNKTVVHKVFHEDDLDYTIILIMPNGNRVPLLIPKDLDLKDDNCGIGLNLISGGHYD